MVQAIWVQHYKSAKLRVEVVPVSIPADEDYTHRSVFSEMLFGRPDQDMERDSKRPQTDPEKNELQLYLNDSLEAPGRDPLEWWKASIYYIGTSISGSSPYSSQSKGTILYPSLACMARDYLGIASTSVECERSFSEAGDIISVKQNQLGTNSIKASMLLSSWYSVPVPSTNSMD